MSELWYEGLGFYENPFSIKPIFSKRLFGYDGQLDTISQMMNDGGLVVVKGDYGFGKTTLLKKLIKDFGGKKKLVFMSCNRYENEIDVEDIINGAGNFISKMLNKKPRDIHLVLDEAHDLTEDEIEELYEGYMDNFFKSIVFISTFRDQINFSDEMKEKVDIVELKGISKDDAVKLVKNRLDGANFISEKIINKIYNISGSNPRVFLSNCEDVCRAAFEENNTKVSDKHLTAIL